MACRGALCRSLYLLVVLGLAGCSTIEGYPVRWPWSKTSMLAEKYDLPPVDDARYSNPPTYPKETMTPVLQVKDSPNSPKRPFTGGPNVGVGVPPPGAGGY